MRKPTVTIGIPAYNEEGNIWHLITSLLNQSASTFNLKTIFVASDASKDSTNDIVRSFEDTRVKLIDNRTNKGVSKRQNQIISKTNTDILIILNADILPKNKKFLEHLVDPIVNKNADLVAAKLTEIPPRTYFERILVVGTKYRHIVFEKQNNGNNLFTCHGAARSFSKNMYKNLRFRESSGEDMYSYLYCVSKGYKYYYAKKAIAYYKMPETFSDHVKQSTRFFSSLSVQKKYFDVKLVDDETELSSRLFISEYLRGITNEFALLFYPVVTLLTFMSSRVNQMSVSSLENYSTASSSKTLKR